MKKLLKHSFYDYIRILKPATIRYLKNISLLVAAICMIATIVILTQPKEKAAVKKPQPSGASSDKKIQIEQAKKNSILRRFISYNELNKVSY